eukprot:12915358-Prorocentrum_lima.AAC.1
MKGVRTPQEDFHVRKEELYLPQAVQEEVTNKTFEHGFINPAAGLKSSPVATKEVAESRGDAMLEW